MDYANVERMCRQFVDSLLSSSRYHTLCLNIRDRDFPAIETIKAQLESKEQAGVECHDEPTPSEFAAILEGIGGKTALVTFDDLDKHPKCLDQLSEHVRKPDPGGKLVLMSPDWDSDNTVKERELRKHCLFYQHSPQGKKTA